MAKKQTKRQRKFQATGGVQKRLEKGTISKRKGSGSKNRLGDKKSTQDKPSKSDGPNDKNTQTVHTDDFMGHENLGNLDVDRFFAQFAEKTKDENTTNTRTDSALQSKHGDDVDIEEEDDDDHMIEEDEEEEEEDDADSEDGDDVEGNDDDDDDGEEKDEDDDDDNSEMDDDDDVERMEAQMKRQMKKMQTTDPEFHSFLKENEESLLEYNDTDDEDDNGDDADNADDEDIEEGNDDEAVVDEATAKRMKQNDSSSIVTTELLQSVVQNTFQKHSMKSLKKLMNIYKSACYLNVNIDSSASGSKKKSAVNDNTMNKPLPYNIEPSSRVYDEVMMICFQKLHTEFQYHLLGNSSSSHHDDDGDDDDDEDMNQAVTTKEDEEAEWNKALQPKVLERSERWNEMKQVLLSFYRSTLHLLMEVKELEFLAMICQNVKYYIRYMTPFPRISDLFLKTFINLWSAPIDTLENYQVVRLNAFLRIRQLALLQPFPFIEDCLKKTYLAYMKRAKFGNISIHSPTLPTLTFMGNCLVELYNIDYHSSYQHAFVYIRQLALLLRGVMQKKTVESMQQVYCWQYVQCLKLWVAVLSSAAQQENDDHGKVDMKSLIYPLIEIIMGTIRLIPSPVRHLPYRCHCVRLLHQLAASTELFIPTTSTILECFDWKEFTLVPKKTKESNRASTRGVQISMMIKFGKEDPLRTHDQLEASMNELFLLLNREIDLYRYSPGFPEYAIRIIVRLRQLNKEVRNPRWKTYIKACIELCDTYTLNAVQGRSKLQQAPREVQQLECLKPIGEKSMYERYTDSVRKEQATLDAINGVSSSVNRSNKRSAESDHGDDDDSDDAENVKSAKAKKKKRQKKKTNTTKSMEDLKEYIMEDHKVMEAADQVQEGINWSDDEDE